MNLPYSTGIPILDVDLVGSLLRARRVWVARHDGGMASRTPYGDSVERLRLALKLLEGFRSRVAALPEGPSRADAAIAAAALASVHETASDPGPDFVPSATFQHAKEGFAFATGPQGTGYYRMSSLDAAVSRPGKPANRHARVPSTELSAPSLTGSPSLEDASSGGPCSELNGISAGGSPRSHIQTQQSSSAERFASRASNRCTAPQLSVLAVPRCAQSILAAVHQSVRPRLMSGQRLRATIDGRERNQRVPPDTRHCRRKPCLG